MMQQGTAHTQHQPDETEIDDGKAACADCYMLTTLLGGIVVFTALAVSLAQEDSSLGDWLKTGLIVAKLVTPPLAFYTQRPHQPRIAIVTDPTGSQYGIAEVGDSRHPTASPVRFEVPLSHYPPVQAQAERDDGPQEIVRVENPMNRHNVSVGAAAPAVDPTDPSSSNPEP